MPRVKLTTTQCTDRNHAPRQRSSNTVTPVTPAVHGHRASTAANTHYSGNQPESRAGTALTDQQASRYPLPQLLDVRDESDDTSACPQLVQHIHHHVQS